MNETELHVLRALAQRCNDIAQEKGWHEEEEGLQNFLLHMERWVEKNPKLLEELSPQGLKFVESLRWREQKANGVDIPQKLMLIVTEAAEAMEAFRHKGMDPQKTYYEALGEMRAWDAQAEASNAKPEGIGSEMADIVVRVLHKSVAAGIDVVTEIARKMRYNESRPNRHGGKRA